jgi:peptidoglycan/LPS O-acetylase OafA/YrhL
MSEQRRPVGTGVRPEIQALRAFAVLVVVVYHLWPGRLTGGFVGVDVFFVISGFLITAHLLREAGEGRLSLTAFWARRARRLLPAALTTIVVSGAIVIWCVPMSSWEQFFRELGAAGLYVENWALAADSVDYLAADNTASPVQHFWSLSAEEQFYLAWPVLILVGLLIARARGSAMRPIVVAILSTLTGVSLIWSVVQSATDPSVAYFSTFTRAWEFGAGGLLAVFAPSDPVAPPRVRTAVSALGWTMACAAVVLYTSDIPFPSATAALPVVGTLGVIWAGSAGLRLTPTFVGRIRPVQFVGDISYSVYLWHWPLIVLLPYVLPGVTRTTAVNVGLLAAAIVLGWLSKRWIEDRVRTGGLSRRRPALTLIATAGAMALVAAGAGVGLTAFDRQIVAEDATVTRYLEEGTPCFGAAAHDPAVPCDASAFDGLIIPSVATSRHDFSVTTWRNCASQDEAVIECVLGVDGGERVALIGDSHAHQWLPALEDLATQEDWEIHLFVKGGCAFTTAVRQGGSDECPAWNSALAAELAAEPPYRVVFTSQRAEINQNIVPVEGMTPADTAVAGFEEAWAPLIARGTQVIGIHDVPDSRRDTRACVAQHDDDPAVCDMDAATSLRHDDYLADAAAATPGVRVVDLTRFFCGDGTCPAVIGGVLVYRDSDHITRAMVRTLAPYLLAASQL